MSSPPAWVLRCLAPWINSWSKNGRVATEKDHQFTAQKSIIVDSDKMVSSEIFAEYDKHVATEVTIEQETRVACTLVQKIQEKNIEELRNVVQQLVAKNVPFAILAQTEIARKLKNKEVSFIHILRPFASAKESHQKRRNDNKNRKRTSCGMTERGGDPESIMESNANGIAA